MAHITYNYEGSVVDLSDLSRKLKAKGVRGASKSNLTRVFSGRHDPRYSLLKAMAEVRGTDMGEMCRLLEHCRKQVY